MKALAFLVVVMAAFVVAGAGAKTPVKGPWDGTWSTSKGTMTLTQKGTHVTGTYTHDQGRISGTALGLTLAGTWREEPSYAGPGDAGSVLLQMKPDRLRFTGTWAFEEKTPGGSWTGVRAET